MIAGLIFREISRNVNLLLLRCYLLAIFKKWNGSGFLGILGRFVSDLPRQEWGLKLVSRKIAVQ